MTTAKTIKNRTEETAPDGTEAFPIELTSGAVRWISIATLTTILNDLLEGEVSDSNFRVVDNGDNTKKLAFEVDDIATATTRTVTWPDNDIDFTTFTISVNGSSGVVVLDPDDLDDSATTNKFTTAAEITKLSGIETGADVTDFANVESSLEGGVSGLTGGVPASDDELIFFDTSASDNMRKCTPIQMEKGLVNMEVYTVGATWTKGTGTKYIRVQVQGAGGGGGGGAPSTGAQDGEGGNGGAYAERFLSVEGISSATLTIGAGGTGGSTSTDGTDGGLSRYADGVETITANGGPGGEAGDGDQDYNTPATATGGDLNIPGSYGMVGSGDGGNNGGHSHFGWGGHGQVANSTQLDASDGVGYGSGGGGGSGNGTTANETGGDGAGGIIVIYSYA
jgi:hypothetical protein